MLGARRDARGRRARRRHRRRRCSAARTRPSSCCRASSPRPSGSRSAPGLGSELLLVTESLHAMQSLVRRAREQGAPAVTRSQFSDDPARDLLVQATAVDADVLAAAAAARGRSGPRRRRAGARLGGVHASCSSVTRPSRHSRPSRAVAVGAERRRRAGGGRAGRAHAAPAAACPLLVLPGSDRRGERRVRRAGRAADAPPACPRRRGRPTP